MDSNKIKQIIKEEIQSILQEVRKNYWPGYYSDATADTIYFIKERFAQNDLDKELDKLYKEYSKPAEESEREIYERDKEESLFFRKEIYSNIIATLLQDWMVVPEKHVNQAIQNYKDILNDPKRKEYLNEEELAVFEETIPIIIDRLENAGVVTYKEKEDKNEEKMVYEPGFLENDIAKDLVDMKFDKNTNSSKKDIFLNKFSDQELKEIIEEAKDQLDEEEQEKIKDFDYIFDDIDSFSREKLMEIVFILIQ